MSLFFRIKGVDWSGKGFPLVSGFVAMANIEAAFDFRPREGRLNEATGKGFMATPYRNLLNGTPLIKDESVIQDTTNGLGIIVRNGALDYGLANRAYLLGGAEAFTVMIVGGYSGMPFDANQPVQGPQICNLLDIGNGVSGALEDRPPMLQQHSNGTLGGRVRSGASSNIGSTELLGKKSCFFLSYDGAKFVYTNKSTGASVSKTNSELGLTSASLEVHARAPRMISGNSFTVAPASAITGLYPELYQVAKWNKVLNAAEMQAQYESSKLLFAAAGI